jgi:hypothetical protein
VAGQRRRGGGNEALPRRVLASSDRPPLRGGGSKVLSRLLQAWEKKRTWRVQSYPPPARFGSPRA